MKQILLILCVPLIIYFLYIKGYAPVSAKRAIMFLGRRKNNMLGASCTACSGFIQYVLPLTPGKSYRFKFESEMSEGEITLEIYCRGRLVYTFSGQSSGKTLKISKGRYTAKTKYHKASGIYSFKWDEV